MCGIVGHIGPTPVDLQPALDAIRHRGPDDTGTWSNHNGHWAVALGFVRLAIIDLSAAGHQPMANEDGSIWLVFNGEIYNYRELRRELEAAGHVFRSQADSETILHCYEHYGDDFLSRLRGMFALALWDGKRQRLMAARDRLGIKPFFWSDEGGRLAFGSEIKALLALGGGRDIDPRGLEGYLRYLYVPPPFTMFRQIRRLAAGHRLVWQAGKTEVERYWRPPAPDPARRHDIPALVDELRSLLGEAVRLHLASDVPLGAFLSGGLDSSTIVALMAQHASEPVRTFCMTFGDGEELFDEREYARKVSDHFGTLHVEIPVNPTVAELLPTMVRHFDEPFGNPTALLVYLLSRETRKHVTVALAGDGGDEVFLGYPRYRGAWAAKKYRVLPRLLRAAVARGFAPLIRESTRGIHALRRAREFLATGTGSVESAYEAWVGYYGDDELAKLLRGGLPDGRGCTPMAELFSESPAADVLDRITSVDLGSFLPENLLHYTDQMSMAHALEVRVPFCDHRLVEFMASIPFATKMNGMQPKHLLREAMKDVLPRATMSRGKLGFNPPMGMWLRRELRPMVEDYLSGPRLERQGFLNAGYVKRVVAAHMSGRRDFSLHIWALLVFQQWLALYQGDAA